MNQNVYYNRPSRLMEVPPGPVDKVLPPSFLVSAAYVMAGHLMTKYGFSQTLGTALKLIAIVPAYKAWEQISFGSDVGKGV